MTIYPTIPLTVRSVGCAVLGLTLAVGPAHAQADDHSVPVAGCPMSRPANGVGPNYIAFSNWTTTASNGAVLGQGNPATITWGVVPDGATIPAHPPDIPAPTFSNLRARINATYPGAYPAWLAAMTSAMNEWSAANGLTLTFEAADDGATMENLGATTGAPGVLGVRADIRIGGTVFALNRLVAFSHFPTTSGLGGDIVVNSIDPNLFAGPNATRVAYWRNVMLHEVGHSLGLGHMCPAMHMRPVPSTTQTLPLHIDEVLAAHHQFGDVFEPDDNAATARTLTLSATGARTYFESNRSITAKPSSQDLDTYNVTVTTPGNVTVTVTPVGGSLYQIWPVTPTGGVDRCDPCVGSACQNRNPMDFGDLRFTVVGPGGAMTTVNSTVNGGIESTTIFFDTPGVMQVTVLASNLFQAQRYSIEFQIVPAFPIGSTCQSGTVVSATGAPENVLRVNNSFGGVERRVFVPVNAGATLQVLNPTVNGSTPAAWALWILPGTPASSMALPLGPIGTACFGPAPTGAGLLFMDSVGGGLFAGFGAPAPFSINLPTLFTGPTVLTAQGVIFDSTTPYTPQLRLTNAIIVESY